MFRIRVTDPKWKGMGTLWFKRSSGPYFITGNRDEAQQWKTRSGAERRLTSSGVRGVVEPVPDACR